MAAFNLTAELNLRGPSNLSQVVSNIRRQLSTISLNLNINPATSAGIRAVTSDVNILSTALRDAQTNAVALGTALRGLGASVGNLTSAATALGSVSSNIANVGNRANNAVGSIRAASSEMSEFGRQSALAIRRFAAFSVATGAVYALARSITSAYGEFIKFNQEFVRLQQVTDSSSASLQGLSNEITRLSTSLGVSSQELLNVSVTLAQAGMSAGETKTALEALAKSALAPSFDSLNDTVEGSIALMRQFGISASDLENSLGSINSVAAKFAVEASDIITAIQRTGGVFAAASRGVSEGKDALNEFIAVFTSVRATTRESAETIATGLRTIFTRIQRGSTIEALREFGVSLTDLQGKFVGPYEAVRRLSEGLKSLDPRDLRFSQIVEELGGFRQIGKVLPLIQQFATAQQALGVAQRGAGSLAADAATAQESLANKMTKVREQFVTLVRDIGQSQGFQTFVDVSLKLASALISVADAAKGVLPALAAITAIRGVGALGQFFGGFSSGLGRSRNPRGFATGGLVPGSGSGDTVPAMLTPGEFVIRKNAVQTIGVSNLHHMNKYGRGGKVKGYANGGIVVNPQQIGAFFLTPESDMDRSPIPLKGSGNIRNPSVLKQLGFNKSTSKYRDEAFANADRATQAEILGLPLTRDSRKINLTFGDITSGAKKNRGKLRDLNYDPPKEWGSEDQLKAAKAKIDEKINDGKLSVGGEIVPISGSISGYYPGVSDLKRSSIANIVEANTKQGLYDTVLKSVRPIITKLNNPVIKLSQSTAEGGASKIAGDENARRTTEGFVFEGLIESITGAALSGNQSNFDFPASSISSARPSLQAMFTDSSGEGLSSLIKADAKRSNSGTAISSMITKISNDINAGHLEGISLIKMASGGHISGKDTVPAMLTPGEFVINKSAAQKLGSSTLHQLNNADKIHGYNSGGFVQSFAAGGSALPARPSNPTEFNVVVPPNTIMALREMSDALQRMGLSASASAKLIERGSSISIRESERALQNDITRLRMAGASATDVYNMEQRLATVRTNNARKLDTANELRGFDGSRLQDIQSQAQRAEGRITRRLINRGATEEEIAANRERIRNRAYEDVTAGSMGTTRRGLRARGMTGDSIREYIDQSMMNSSTLKQMNSQLLSIREQEIQARVRIAASAGASAEEQKRMTTQLRVAAREEVAERKRIARQLAQDRGLDRGGFFSLSGVGGRMQTTAALLGMGDLRADAFGSGENFLHRSLGIVSTGRRQRFAEGWNNFSGGLQRVGFGLSLAGGMLGDTLGNAVGGKEGQGFGAGSAAFAGAVGVGAMFGPFGALAGIIIGVTSAMKAYRQAIIDATITENATKVETESIKLQRSFERLNKSTKRSDIIENLTSTAAGLGSVASAEASKQSAIVSKVASNQTTAQWWDNLGTNMAEIEKELMSSARQTNVVQNLPQIFEQGISKGFSVAQIEKMFGAGGFGRVKEQYGLASGDDIIKGLVAKREEALERKRKGENVPQEFIDQLNQTIQNLSTNLFNKDILQPIIERQKAEQQMAAATAAATVKIDLLSNSLTKIAAANVKADAQFAESQRKVAMIIGSRGGSTLGIQGPDRSNENILANPLAYNINEVRQTIGAAGQQYGFNPQLVQEAQLAAGNQRLIAEILPPLLAEMAAKENAGAFTGEKDPLMDVLRSKLDEILKSRGVDDKSRQTILDKVIGNLANKLDKEKGASVQDILASDPTLANIVQNLDQQALKTFFDLIKSGNDRLAVLFESAQQWASKFEQAGQIKINASNIGIESNNQLAKALGYGVGLNQLNAPFENTILTLTQRIGANGQGIAGSGTLDSNTIMQRLIDKEKEQKEIQDKMNKEKPAEGSARYRELDDQLRRSTLEARNLATAHKKLAEDSSRAANVLQKISELKQLQENKQSSFLDLLKSVGKPEEMMKFTDEFKSFGAVMSGGLRRSDIANNPDFWSNAVSGLELQMRVMRPEDAQETQRQFIQNANAVLGENNPELKRLLDRMATSMGTDNQLSPEMQGLVDEYSRLTDVQINAAMQQANMLTSAAQEAHNLIIQGAQEARATLSASGQNNPSVVVPLNQNKGGMIYASGGKLINFKPQGSDTVPAMLTPGEFVVNARSTQQNLGLLKAINSGKIGGYSSGGIVYLGDGGQVEAEEAKKNEEIRTQLTTLIARRRARQQSLGRYEEIGGVRTFLSNDELLSNEAAQEQYDKLDTLISEAQADLDRLPLAPPAPPVPPPLPRAEQIAKDKNDKEKAYRQGIEDKKKAYKDRKEQALANSPYEIKKKAREEMDAREAEAAKIWADENPDQYDANRTINGKPVASTLIAYRQFKNREKAAKIKEASAGYVVNTDVNTPEARAAAASRNASRQRLFEATDRAAEKQKLIKQGKEISDQIANNSLDKDSLTSDERDALDAYELDKMFEEGRKKDEELAAKSAQRDKELQESKNNTEQATQQAAKSKREYEETLAQNQKNKEERDKAEAERNATSRDLSDPKIQAQIIAEERKKRNREIKQKMADESNEPKWINSDQPVDYSYESLARGAEGWAWPSGWTQKQKTDFFIQRNIREKYEYRPQKDKAKSQKDEHQKVFDHYQRLIDEASIVDEEGFKVMSDEEIQKRQSALANAKAELALHPIGSSPAGMNPDAEDAERWASKSYKSADDYLAAKNAEFKFEEDKRRERKETQRNARAFKAGVQNFTGAFSAGARKAVIPTIAGTLAYAGVAGAPFTFGGSTVLLPLAGLVASFGAAGATSIGQEKVLNAVAPEYNAELNKQMEENRAAAIMGNIVGGAAASQATSSVIRGVAGSAVANTPEPPVKSSGSSNSPMPGTPKPSTTQTSLVQTEKELREAEEVLFRSRMKYGNQTPETPSPVQPKPLPVRDALADRRAQLIEAGYDNNAIDKIINMETSRGILPRSRIELGEAVARGERGSIEPTSVEFSTVPNPTTTAAKTERAVRSVSKPSTKSGGSVRRSSAKDVAKEAAEQSDDQLAKGVGVSTEEMVAQGSSPSKTVYEITEDMGPITQANRRTAVKSVEAARKKAEATAAKKAAGSIDSRPLAPTLQGIGTVLRRGASMPVNRSTIVQSGAAATGTGYAAYGLGAYFSGGSLTERAVTEEKRKREAEKKKLEEEAKKAQTKNLGGLIYASKGTLIPYRPIGTDTVPAMLTPGEFVVNRRATQQNMGLLKAINRGENVAPRLFNKGGFVNTQYFGAGSNGAVGSPSSSGGISDIKVDASSLESPFGIFGKAAETVSSAVAQFAQGSDALKGLSQAFASLGTGSGMLSNAAAAIGGASTSLGAGITAFTTVSEKLAQVLGGLKDTSLSIKTEPLTVSGNVTVTIQGGNGTTNTAELEQQIITKIGEKIAAATNGGIKIV